MAKGACCALVSDGRLQAWVPTWDGQCELCLFEVFVFYVVESSESGRGGRKGKKEVVNEELNQIHQVT